MKSLCNAAAIVRLTHGRTLESRKHAIIQLHPFVAMRKMFAISENTISRSSVKTRAKREPAFQLSAESISSPKRTCPPRQSETRRERLLREPARRKKRQSRSIDRDAGIDGATGYSVLLPLPNRLKGERTFFGKIVLSPLRIPLSQKNFHAYLCPKQKLCAAGAEDATWKKFKKNEKRKQPRVNTAIIKAVVKVWPNLFCCTPEAGWLHRNPEGLI